jgi:hypothetical protein
MSTELIAANLFSDGICHIEADRTLPGFEDLEELF